MRRQHLNHGVVLPRLLILIILIARSQDSSIAQELSLAAGQRSSSPMFVHISAASSVITGAQSTGILRYHSDRRQLIKLMTSRSNGAQFAAIAVTPPELSLRVSEKDTFGLTTSMPEAKAWFDCGMLYLYRFEDDQADSCFIKVALLDPDCALAYWGMSLANSHNPDFSRALLGDAADLMTSPAPNTAPMLWPCPGSTVAPRCQPRRTRQADATRHPPSHRASPASTS